MRALIGMRDGAPMPPVVVLDVASGSFRYRLNDGFHRFRASIALGYSHIPIVGGWHAEMEVETGTRRMIGLVSGDLPPQLAPPVRVRPVYRQTTAGGLPEEPCTY